MPLYEYQCQDCQNVFKERKPFSQSSETAVCPTCESIQTQKVIGSVAFISNGRLPTSNRSIPLNMSGGGCACGGSCGCGGH